MRASRKIHHRNGNHHHPGMRKQLETVLEDIRGLGTETKHTAQEQLDSVRSAVEDYARQSRAKVKGYVRQGQKRATAMERTFEDRIRRQPMKTLLMASGLGFLCGLFFSRR